MARTAARPTVTAVRKAIVTLAVGSQRPLLRLSQATVAPYARRHGYDLHVHKELLAHERPASWSRVPALQRLQDRYDVLVWLDVDLMVVDPSTDIADELQDGRFLYLVEHPTPEGPVPNAGVLMLRTGELCAEFLDRVWGSEDLIDHRWWENAAICRLLGYALDPVRRGPSTPWRDATRFLSPRWNSITDAPAPNPRIRHYPGFKVATRAAFMTRDLVASRLS